MVNLAAAAFEFSLDVFAISGICLLWFRLKDFIKKIYDSRSFLFFEHEDLENLVETIVDCVMSDRELLLHETPPPYTQAENE